MPNIVMFQIPEDQELLSAFGKVALRHEQLNHILRMTIKTLAQLTHHEALDATNKDGSRKLRDRICKLARQRLGEGQSLLKLLALMERCKRATEKRNEYVHRVWAKELDGDFKMQGSDHEWKPIPTRQELIKLSEEILELVKDLNLARSDGFLSEALAKRPI
jgi:hypothetical protein